MKSSYIIAIVLAICVISAVSSVSQAKHSAASQKEHSKREDLARLEQGQLENLALTQYYRWFLAFESDQRPAQIDQHLSLLVDDVDIVTSAGPLKGAEGVKGFLGYVKDWQNAHHINAFNIKRQTGGAIALEADIEYQNILPNGQANRYILHYKTQLATEAGELLPRFTELELLPVQTLAEPKFEDAYAKNRALSFVRYWSYLLDHVEGNEAVIKSLLAPQFSVNFEPDNSLTTEAQIDQWLAFMKSGFGEMLHKPVNIQVLEKAPNQYQVTFNYHWQGFNLEGERMTLKTHHQWLLLNNPDDDFPKLADLDMTVLEPFTKVESFSL